LTTAVFLLPSPIPKRPAKPRTGAVVASRKVGRRPVVPVAIERDVPLQVAEQLHVVSSVQIEMDTARLENPGDIQVGLVEPEKFRLPADQTGCDTLRALRDDGMLIVRVLPGEAAEQRDGGVVSVLQEAANAAAEHRLQSDVLLRALQEVTKTRVEPIVPAQETETTEIQLVPGGRTRAGTRRQSGVEAGLSGPAFSRVRHF